MASSSHSRNRWDASLGTVGRTPLPPGPVSLLIREARSLPASAAAQHQSQAVQSEDKLLGFSLGLTWTAKGAMPCSRAPRFLGERKLK